MEPRLKDDTMPPDGPSSPALSRPLPARAHDWLLARRRALGNSTVARNSAWMMGSEVSLALLQAMQFLLLARALGPDQFGRIAGVTAITSALLPYAGLGLGNVALMRIARGEGSARLYLGNALAVTMLTGIVGVALAVAIVSTLLHEPGMWLIVLLLATSEILLYKSIDVAAHVFYGLEKHHVGVMFYNLHLLVRLACVGALFVLPSEPTALQWAQLHLASGAFSTAVVLVASTRVLGRPRLALASGLQDARQGIFFSVHISGRSLQTDSDKWVLARHASPATAGIYTPAFRLAYMACVPIFAVLLALQARLFRRGHQSGLHGTLRAVRVLAMTASAYCIVIGAALYLLAPYVPLLLGERYAGSSEILRWLCLLPFFLSFQAVCSAALSAADAQRPLGLLHSLTAAVSIALNLALVPLHGWQGAALAAYASQAFLLLGMVVLTVALLRASHRTERSSA